MRNHQLPGSIFLTYERSLVNCGSEVNGKSFEKVWVSRSAVEDAQQPERVVAIDVDRAARQSNEKQEEYL